MLGSSCVSANLSPRHSRRRHWPSLLSLSSSLGHRRQASGAVAGRVLTIRCRPGITPSLSSLPCTFHRQSPRQASARKVDNLLHFHHSPVAAQFLNHDSYLNHSRQLNHGKFLKHGRFFNHDRLLNHNWFFDQGRFFNHGRSFDHGSFQNHGKFLNVSSCNRTGPHLGRATSPDQPSNQPIRAQVSLHEG
jgi:hypothetical protein